MERRALSRRFQALADELISSNEFLEHIRGSSVKVSCLVSDKEKTNRRRAVFAECERVPDKYRWAIDCDFTITVFEPNVERLNDEQLSVLMLHELLHIGVEIDGNEELYFVQPHDIEDFREIIERYGMDWSDG